MPHDFKPQSAKDEHYSRDFQSFERKEHYGSPDFIGKYILVLDRDTFRLEVDYRSIMHMVKVPLIKTQAREWR